MHISVRSRVFLARHRWVYWAIVLAIAAAIGALVYSQASALEARRQEWGSTRSVLVATTDLTPNGPIDVHTQDVPLAMIPDTALDEVPDGARLHQRVARGAILVEADVVSGSGPAAHAPPDSVVVGLVDPLSRNASIGLRVRVTSEGIVLALDATVVDVVDEVIFVAVAERDGPAVASAAQLGVASLIFLP